MAAAKFSRHEAMKSRLDRLLARAAPDDVALFVEAYADVEEYDADVGVAAALVPGVVVRLDALG